MLPHGRGMDGLGDVNYLLASGGETDLDAIIELLSLHQSARLHSGHVVRYSRAVPAQSGREVVLSQRTVSVGGVYQNRDVGIREPGRCTHILGDPRPDHLVGSFPGKPQAALSLVEWRDRIRVRRVSV